MLVKTSTEDYGLTVSEFIRYKIFSTPSLALQEPETLQDIMPDEEREAIKMLIQEQREKIAQLTTELRQTTQDQISLSGSRQKVNVQSSGLQSQIENDPEIATFIEWLDTTKEGKECLYQTGFFFTDADLSGLYITSKRH